MAITRTKQDSLVDVELDSQSSGKNLTSAEQALAQSERKGFIRSTLQELREVEWPSFQYTVRWALVIVLFTAIMSIALGYVDLVFTDGLKFVDCTTELTKTPDEGAAAPDRNAILGDCSRDFLNGVTFRNQ